MRIPQLLVAMAVVALIMPARTIAQQEEEEKKKESTEQEAPKPAAKPLEPADKRGDLKPLLPPEDDTLQGGLPPPPPGFKEVTMDEASAAKPPLNVLDLHGYFRLRGVIDHGLDLGQSNHPTIYSQVPEDRGVSYPQFPGSASGRTDTLAGANLRFRLEPTINISEDVRIMAQIDMLDNLIMGSTPDGYPMSGYFPLVAFSQGQVPPSDGVNALKDSILVKRVWGEVMTPVGLLRFGRMGSHWGLGLLANDGGPSFQDRGPMVTQTDPFSPVGQCFDCDYGSTADRIMFITKIAGHYIVPMIDFTAEGPYFTRIWETQGQPFDLDQLDDVNSYILAVAKRDKPEDIKNALDRDEWVLNYGLYFVYRNQALDPSNYHKFPAGTVSSDALDASKYTVRNAEAYIPDIWVRFMWGKLRLELEAVMIYGKIGDSALEATLDENGDLISSFVEGKVDLLQFGTVLQGDYTFMNDQLVVGLELGYASGDNSPGMGVRPFDEKQFSHPDGDHNVKNFRFNPDYHVDLILWRQIMGTVTDALYIKPSLQYNIAEGMGTKISAIYSSAIYPESTRGKSSPLGLEFNADLFYFSDDKFHAGFSYGILIPLSGMDYLGEDMISGGGLRPEDQDDDGDIAHRFLCRLVLHF